MEVKMLNMKDVVPNKLQPRQVFDQEKLQELANSIKEGELLQPIVVRMNGNKGKYQIVCGERRYKAFQILDEPKIPAIIRLIKDDTDALEKSLIENLQRDDLTSVERENAIGSLWDSKRYKNHSELARKLGVQSSPLSALLRARDDRITLDAASNISTRVLSSTEGLKNEPRKKILEQISEGKIKEDNVRDVVRKVKEFKEPEQQMEILDEFEKKESWGKQAFDDIIQNKKEIAEGKRHREIIIGKEEYGFFMDDLEKACTRIKGFGIANLSNLPKAKKDKALNMWVETIAYMLNELKKIDEKRFNKLGDDF